MSLETIRSMADKAARDAAKNRKQPYVPYDKSEIEDERFRLPFIGDYAPPGWEKVDDWFADTSGFGTEDEPAMTIAAVKRGMVENLTKPDDYGYAITEVGQFQARIGVFKRVPVRKKKASKRGGRS